MNYDCYINMYPWPCDEYPAVDIDSNTIDDIVSSIVMISEEGLRYYLPRILKFTQENECFEKNDLWKICSFLNVLSENEFGIATDKYLVESKMESTRWIDFGMNQLIILWLQNYIRESNDEIAVSEAKFALKYWILRCEKLKKTGL